MLQCSGVGNIRMKKELKKIDSRGREEVWEWEETPETTEALRKFYEISKLVKDNKK